MPNALDKALAQRAEETKGTPAEARKVLIARLKELPQDQIVKVVESLSLPSSTGKWTLEQLREVVTTVEGKPVSAGAQANGRTFVLLYNEGDNTLVAVNPGMTTEEWDAFTPEDGISAVLVTSPDDLGEVPTDVLLAVFNAGKGTKAKKFADPSTAREQAFSSMSAIVDGAATQAEGAAKKAAKTPKEPKEPKAPKLMNKEPKAKDQIKQVGAGTKIATLIDLLAQEEGTTIADIETALSASGKPIKAAAWLGYDLNTVAGYGVRQDGDRLYLVLPKGMNAPLDHKVREAKPAKVAAAPAAEAEAPAAPAAPAKKGGAKKGAAPAAAPEAPAAAAAPVAKKGLPPALAAANAARKAAKEKAAAEAAAAKTAKKGGGKK